MTFESGRFVTGANADRSEALLQQIEATPGANLRQLHRYTDIPLSTTARLLDALEAEGRIRSEIDRRTRHFYPAGKGLHARERIVLRFVSKPRPRAILQAILEEPGIRHSGVSERVGLPPPTATYYLKQMKAADVVLTRRSGAEVFYRIKNPDMLRRALERTGEGFQSERA